MAISMSSATVDQSERENLLSSNVDSSVTAGGATANTSGGFFGLGAKESGASIAGITEDFAKNVKKEIDTYIEDINTEVESLSNPEVNQAFKGAGVEGALKNFVNSVKQVAKDYTNRLKVAEQQIIDSVGAAYVTQDTDISGNLKSDSGSLVSGNTSGSGGN